MEAETLFGLARPSGCHGGEESIGERILQLHKDSNIATNTAASLSKWSNDDYEVYEVELTVKRKIA